MSFNLWSLTVDKMPSEYFLATNKDRQSIRLSPKLNQSQHKREREREGEILSEKLFVIFDVLCETGNVDVRQVL